MKAHTGYITKQLRSATEERLLDGISGYNQGYNSGHTPVWYRRIPADILAKIHEVEVEMGRLHDRKERLLRSGWVKGRMPADFANLMDSAKHERGAARLRAGRS
jgi:hypothetical protein